MRAVPATTSSRGTLRHRLPAVFQEQEFAMRFVEAFEQVLDPVGAVLDSLPAHFDPGYAPYDILDLLAAWVGADLDESHSIAQRREVVRRAAELGRRRGTVRGVEMALALAFPDLPLRVEDSGGVYWGDALPAQPTGETGFTVYCDVPLADETAAAIGRIVEAIKPVHAQYRLLIRAAPRTPGSPAP
jgi:phage tail-like protein